MVPLDLDPNFSELLSLFNKHGVRYLLLGGYAVIFYGHPRTTNDFDVWVAVDPANADNVSRALVEYGFPATAVPAATFTQVGKVFRFGRPPTRVELLTSPSGVEFEVCWADRVQADIGGTQVNFIDLRHLRENKRAAGRAKDLADLEELPEP